MNRAAKRYQKKLARKLAKNGRGRPPQPLGRALFGAPENQVSELVQKGVQVQQAGQAQEAEAIYRQVLGIDPSHADANHLLGVLLDQAGNHVQAVEMISRAIATAPDQPMYHNNLGNVLKIMGRLEEAAASYRKALVINPDCGEAHMHMAGIKKHIGYDNDIKAMEERYASSDISDEQRIYLAFGLGKAFEDLRQYEKAFNFFLAGNTIKRKTQSYSIDAQDQFFKKTKEIFDSSLFDKHQGAGCEDDSPIFIVGMPRSGSTLVEQILASHPQVYGFGEVATLPQIINPFLSKFPGSALAEGIRECNAAEFERLGVEYIDAIKKHTKKAGFATDKALSNFQLIGMIKLILPNAKIIHCCRDPIDTCLSIFKTYFSGSGVRYTYDLIELGRYYDSYRDLMKYWHSVLPDFIYDIQYEELVADQEEQTRLLLNCCNLAWDDTCLGFYKTDRPITTASVEQVRRPIYKDSVQSWKRYELQLAPVLEILG